MADSILNLTDEQIAANPWGAIEAAVHNNPTDLAVALAAYTDIDVPEDPTALFTWIQAYYERHGNLDVLAEASKDVQVVGSSQAKNFNWAGLIGGVIQGAINGLGIGGGSSPSEAQIAAQLAAAEAKRRTTNTILIIAGIVVAGLIAFLVLKK